MTLATFDQSKVSQRFYELPEEIKEILLDQTITDTMSACLEGLDTEKQWRCNHQVTLVLVGMADRSTLKDSIAEVLEGTDQNKHIGECLQEKVCKPYFKKVLGLAPEPIRNILLNNIHRDAVVETLKPFNLDEVSTRSITSLVELSLMRLITMATLREELRAHKSVTVEQGEAVMIKLEETLFAPLVDYLTTENTNIGSTAHVSILTWVDKNDQAKARMTKLPLSVQDVIKGEELQKSFVTLVRKHGLSTDIARVIAKHVSVVLVGLSTTNDFKVNVTKDTGLDPSKLEAVFQDVELSLFKPVRTAILTALEQKRAGTAPAVVPTPTKDPYRADAS